MKRVKLNAFVRGLCFLLLSTLPAAFAHAQIGTLTKRPNVNINPNCNGYLEYLPYGYSPAQKYPTIIFMGGMGTTGDGSEAALENHFTNGGFPHEQIRNGTWQDEYTVNGQSHRFIIITPQFRDPYWMRAPTPQELNSVIDYMIARYPSIDTTRIYLTGNSSGGGPVWDYPGASSAYADRLAALVPFCGAAFPAQEKANNIKYSNLPVWTFHNDFDSGVPSSFTKDFVSMINNPTAPNPPARMTIFPFEGHDCWFNAYTRVYTENNLNIYQWMLQYKRAFSTANAGTDREITLPVNSVQFNGRGTGPNGTVASINWTKVSGPAGVSFSNGTTLSPVVSGLTAGAYIFRLTITDNAGGAAANDVAVTVHPSATRIEAENFIAMSGVQTEPTGDAGGGLNVGYIGNGDWMDYRVSVPAAGNYTVRFRTASFVGGAEFQVKDAAGTVLSTVKAYGTGGWQTYMTWTKTIALAAGQQTIRIQCITNDGFNFNWWEIVDGVGGSTPSNQPPTANAGTDQTIILPASSVQLNGSGTDPDGTISSYKWSQVSGPSTASFSSTTAASVTASGLVAGSYTFRLTVTDNSSSTAFDDVIVTVSNSVPSSGRVEAEKWASMNGVQTENTSDAGGGQNVGYIDNGDWMDYTIHPSTAGSYNLSFRVATAMTGGRLEFRKADGTVLAAVTVPNTGGWQAWQTVSANATLAAGQQTVRIVSVASANWNINWFEFSPGSTPANQAPTAHAGTDKNITLPTNSVVLNGSGTDTDGTITGYNWTQVSGPAGETITNGNTANATVNNLVAGTYVFRLTVTDNGSATASDEVTVVVSSSSSTTSIHIEAETFTAQQGVQTENTGDAGGGLNVGWIDLGDWMDYSVNITTSGTHAFSARVATQSTNMQFQVRKQDGTVLATLTVPNTGGWQAWQTITAPVSLAAGTQTLRIYSLTNGGWNLNWIRLTAETGTPSNTPPAANAGADQSITLPSNSVTLNGSGTDADGTISSFAWSQLSGPTTATIQSASSAQTVVSNLSQGSYTFRLTVKDNGNATAFDDVVITVNSSTPSGSTIKVEAENWTNMSGVQTETAMDAGGGRNVGWIDNGDWMEYSINPATSGTYTANFRIATDMTGAQLQVRKPDGTVLATVNLPRTGGWQTWQTVSTTLDLTQGVQTIRLVSMNGSSWNINWFELVFGGAPPPPPPATTKIEAENWVVMNGVQTENTADAGGGQNVGWIDNGDWMEYNITAPSSSTFTMNFRIATPNTGAQLQVRKGDGTVLATVNLPATGGWQSWQTVSASVPLAAGSQPIRIVSTAASGFNINWIELASATAPAYMVSGRMEEDLNEALNAKTEVYPNPVINQLTLKLNDHSQGKVIIQVLDVTGRIQKEMQWSKERNMNLFRMHMDALPKGTYLLNIVSPAGRQTTRFIKL